MANALGYNVLRQLNLSLNLRPSLLQRSSPSKCRGVTKTCTSNGVISCATFRLVLSEVPANSRIYFAKMGGRVKAEATVMMSRRNSSPREATGKDLGLATPKCLMQAASLSMPQLVLTANVMSRFCMGMASPGIISEWSVRLLAPQVIVQTKYIQRNLQDVKNWRGVVSKRLKPERTPSFTVCFPFANQMTERSRMALVGDTAKAVTHPATISCQAGQLF